jgi:hypothetical protein
MSLRKAKIGEAFSLIRNGASIKQKDGASGIPITRIETISNLEIDKETLNQYIDKHHGFVSNKIVAQTIYNSLIDLGFLNCEKINIDYKGLKNLKLSQRTII